MQLVFLAIKNNPAYLKVVSSSSIWQNEVLSIIQDFDVTVWPGEKFFERHRTLEGALDLKKFCPIKDPIWTGCQPGVVRMHHKSFVVYIMPSALKECDDPDFIVRAIFRGCVPGEGGVHVLIEKLLGVCGVSFGDSFHCACSETQSPSIMPNL
ncbi:unnamed protein product [Arctogadus glacialis]